MQALHLKAASAGSIDKRRSVARPMTPCRSIISASVVKRRSWPKQGCLPEPQIHAFEIHRRRSSG
jgi:hypothetical protein